ncbi:hypothetical protein HY522_10470 [bacterium]|nr:hypothetical protein [bacterium]
MVYRMCRMALLGALILAVPAAVRAENIFDQILGGVKKSKVDRKADEASRSFKFTVHLTTGDVLKAIKYEGGGYRSKGSFRFISNFESDISVKLPFIRYVDMDMIGEETLASEYTTSTADRIYLRNADYVTGKIEGFSARDIRVATTYGDLKIDVTQVRYIMFRNPATGSPAGPAKPAKEKKKPRTSSEESGS